MIAQLRLEVEKERMREGQRISFLLDEIHQN